MTAVLAALIHVVFYTYSQRETWPAANKSNFNLIFIGLSIAISLNLVSALKEVVGHLRWWLLSIGQYTPRETDLILQSENLSQLVQLVWVSSSTVVRVFVFVVLALQLAAQIGFALLGTVYSINPSTTSVVLTPGLVSITDMSSIQSLRADLPGSEGDPLSRSRETMNRRYLANIWGIAGNLLEMSIDDLAPAVGTILQFDGPTLFVNSSNPSIIRYHFFESTPRQFNPSWGPWVFTNRSISVMTACQSHQVLAGGDGLSKTVTVRMWNSSDETIVLPSINGPDQRMYMHNAATDSGDSWAAIRAFEASTTNPCFFTCNISFGPVINAQIEEHKVSPAILRYTAAAISLQGYGPSTLGVMHNSSQMHWQSYPFRSISGNDGPSDGDVEMLEHTMSRFAMGSLANIIVNNKEIDVAGMTPQAGITLQVESWESVNMILGLTVAVQLLLVMVAVILCRNVQVRGHSYLATTAFIRPVIQHVGCRASTATGSEVARLMGPALKLRYMQKRSEEFYLHLNNWCAADRDCVTPSCNDCGARR